MATKTYAQLMKQIDELSREAEAIKRKEIDGVIERIKEAISAYGLSAADLGLVARAGAPRGAKPGRKPGRKAAGKKAKAPATVKYKDDQGNTWVGRGARPQWLRDALSAGKSLKDFAV